MYFPRLFCLAAFTSLHVAVRAAPVGQTETDGDSTSGYKFLTAKTKKFLITSMPEVDFDIGEMYGGLVPIDESDPSRALYFIFKPAINKEYQDKKEITIFLNGGPGCSSLGGFLQENGPILWQPGQLEPSGNYFSWANITNMIWVDQPVGAGFSTGKINNTGEYDVGSQFISWFKNWENAFGIKNYKIYVTGESYAGRYVPYISAAMLDANDTTYYDLGGALVYDPVIGSFQYTQESVVTYPFLVENNNVFALSASQLATYQKLDVSCGYAALRDKYLQFPPPGHQPAHGPIEGGKCDIWNNAQLPIEYHNECFNIYEVSQQCPYLFDPLGFTGYNPNTVYFNRQDVKEAIHAPTSVHWRLCGERSVFNPNGSPGPEDEYDNAPDPIQNVLPQVIDATQRVLISNGDLDMIIITNGTLMAIQNMTWGGKLGFQSAPNTPIDFTGKDVGLPGFLKQGVVGTQHFERGLMWAETFLSGHEQPQYQPRVTLLHLSWLLGRVQSL